jgi:hypothetical protein
MPEHPQPFHMQGGKPSNFHPAPPNDKALSNWYDGMALVGDEDSDFENIAFMGPTVVQWRTEANQMEDLSTLMENDGYVTGTQFAVGVIWVNALGNNVDRVGIV